MSNDNNNGHLKKAVCLLATPPLIAALSTPSQLMQMLAQTNGPKIAPRIRTPFGLMFANAVFFRAQLPGMVAANTRVSALRSVSANIRTSTEEGGKEEIAGELANNALSETVLARATTTSLTAIDAYCSGFSNKRKIITLGGTVPKKVGLASITQNLRLTGGGFSIRFGASAVQMACLFRLAPAVDETLATNTKLTKYQQMFTSTFIISAIKAAADNPTKAVESQRLEQTAKSPLLKASARQAATTAFNQLGILGLLCKGSTVTMLQALAVFSVLRGLPELCDCVLPNKIEEKNISRESVNNSVKMPRAG